MDLPPLINDIAKALAGIDASGRGFKDFAPGVGPYGEPQLVQQSRNNFARTRSTGRL